MDKDTYIKTEHNVGAMGRWLTEIAESIFPGNDFTGYYCSTFNDEQ